MHNSHIKRASWWMVLTAVALTAGCGGDASNATPTASSGNRTMANIVHSGAVAALPVRTMEQLGRGVVAVRTGANSVFVSWRLLGLDPAGIGFNLYRASGDAAPVKLNLTPLTAGTNYTDASAPKASAYRYFVRPVVDGVEQADSEAFALKANGAYEPIVRIPIGTPEAGYRTKYVWVGDLDGDGEFDFVLDRLAAEVPDTNGDVGAGNQYLEAYKRDGTPLWRIDLGPNSRNIYNITPGSSTLSVGMYDGATVYDLDGDGRAEVVLKVSNGVKFPDGSTFTHADDKQQFIAILDGLTGKPLATRPFPNNFFAQAGSLGTQLGIGYADGVHPTIYFWGRNRNKDKSFNDVFASWSWDGHNTISENWVLPLAAGAGTGKEASHQMRIIDVDGDGKDEMATGNFMINSDGTLRYVLPGVIHGDRFFITRMDNGGSGMQGYGIQQNNPSGLLEYYYNASTGVIQWTHNTTPGTLVDVGRGLVGDIDARFPGFEVWSFSGLTNGPSGTLTEPDTTLSPWPTHSIWWDGDLLTEGLNDHKIEKWNPLAPTRSNALPRLVTMTSSAYGAPVLHDHNPMFFGDLFGDWRTEVVLMNNTYSELVIFTTNVPSATRLYSMAQNPAYRNHMTIKGYLQSPFPDYYLGDGMSAPPQPSIRYATPLPAQAERSALGGGTQIKSDRAGYRGAGFVSFPASGGSAEFRHVNGATGGGKTLSIRYANGNPTPRTGILRVNGVAQPVTFKPTGSWTVWSTLEASVTVTPGTGNTLRLESTGQSLGNIDELSVN